MLFGMVGTSQGFRGAANVPGESSPKNAAHLIAGGIRAVPAVRLSRSAAA
jgi:hypothetical protein